MATTTIAKLDYFKRILVKIVAEALNFAKTQTNYPLLELPLPQSFIKSLVEKLTHLATNSFISFGVVQPRFVAE